ncbi:MAG: hypothetical protein JSU90_07080 [Nitrospiraceae bacterium]|nr:MAG: hypothetical protein JSU90_07080 [Nitrospiraceae bacterium]
MRPISVIVGLLVLIIAACATTSIYSEETAESKYRARYVNIRIDLEHPQPENINITFQDSESKELKPISIDRNLPEPLEIGENIKIMDRIIWYVTNPKTCVWIDKTRVCG